MNSQKFVGVMLLSDSFCGFFFLCLQFRGMESTIDHWGCLTKASRQAISINISQGDLVEKEVQSSMVISPMGRFGIILVRLVPCLSSFVGGAGLQVPLLCFTGKSCRAFPTSWHGSCLSQKKKLPILCWSKPLLVLVTCPIIFFGVHSSSFQTASTNLNWNWPSAHFHIQFHPPRWEPDEPPRLSSLEMKATMKSSQTYLHEISKAIGRNIMLTSWWFDHQNGECKPSKWKISML